MQDGGFIKVKSRRKKRNKSVFLFNDRHIVVKQGEIEVDINEDLALKKVLDAKVTTSRSQLLKETQVKLESVLSENIEEIICYGLGHFTESRTAQHQLAFLLSIADIFHSSVFIHDPIFYGGEVRILKRLNLNVIPDNEEGKRTLKEGVITLLYLPHCSKQLTNNFLWQNWNPRLKNCIYLGNTFSLVLNSEFESKLNTHYIRRILPYVKEFNLENNCKHSDSFSDTSLHIFPSDLLDTVEEKFWEDSQEPVYPFDDTEFISNLENGHPSDPSDPPTPRIRGPSCEFKQ